MLGGVKRRGSTILTIVCIAVTACGLYNVYGDNKDVVADAQKTACGDQGDACGAQIGTFTRTPWSQTFSVHTPKRDVTVTCKRAAYLVGSYKCTAP
jgi:hypothetical protein